MTRDSLIVGGGVIGLCAALELARAGHHVAVVERDHAPRGASWAGGGILMALPPWETPEALRPLLQDSLRRYPALVRDLAQAGPDPEWEEGGALVLGREGVAQAQAWSEATGEPVEVLDAMGVRTDAPGVHAPDGALHLPRAARIRNPRLLKSLVRHLAELGVDLIFGTEVTGLEIQSGRVAGVQTGSETIAAGQVVIAAGCWTPRLLDFADFPLDVRPMRGQMLLLPAGRQRLRPVILRDDTYLVPRQDGSLVVGSTLESVGFDDGTTPSAREQLLTTAREMFPGLAGSEPLAHWAGLRPATVDGLPFIGPVPGIEGLYVSAGHFRLGLTLAPASARLLADLMLEEPPTVEAGPFALSRSENVPTEVHASAYGGRVNVQ